MSPTTNPTPKDPARVHQSRFTQSQDQPQPLSPSSIQPTSDRVLSLDPNPQQPLRDALSRKEKQLLAAGLGHVDIAIEPLERQIYLLREMLERLKREKGVEWVVVDRSGKTEGSENAEGINEVVRGGRECGRVVSGLRSMGAPMIRGGGNSEDWKVGHEKILGTWI